VTAFGKSEGKDFASRIDAHINNTKCRDCHRLLDSLAIDLHMFDVLGRFKDGENSIVKGDAHLKSMKAKISGSERRLASAFTKNLMTFIKGNQLGIDDLLILEAVLNETEDDGFRARNILQGVISRYFPKQSN